MGEGPRLQGSSVLHAWCGQALSLLPGKRAGLGNDLAPAKEMRRL